MDVGKFSLATNGAGSSQHLGPEVVIIYIECKVPRMFINTVIHRVQLHFPRLSLKRLI
ncbi:uncharacterized protein METZ01_LOCUS244285 [marine metagenome]|uniref:Uncharacterized protein n=1 Tax=marine metagenome TaxID=408172 RepID=A0A382HYA3_9ZZZZ